MECEVRYRLYSFHIYISHLDKLYKAVPLALPDSLDKPTGYLILGLVKLQVRRGLWMLTGIA